MGGSRCAACVLICVIFICAYVEQALSKCPNNCSNHGQCLGTICQCNTGYGGEDCSYRDVQLVNNTAQSGSISNFQWAFYHIYAKEGDSLVWSLNQTSSGDCDIYINVNDFPTRSKYIIRDVSTKVNTQIVQTGVNSGIWVAGIFAFLDCRYQLSVIIYSSCPNDCSGHGTCVAGSCICNSGWGNSDCSLPSASTITPNVPIYGGVPQGAWNYYQSSIAYADTLLIYNLTQTTAGRGDCDIYLRYNAYPSLTEYAVANLSMGATSILKYQALQAGTYYLGIFGFWGCNYSIALNIQGTPGQDCASTSNCSLHGQCPLSIGGICNCYNGFTGNDCETMTAQLTLGQSVDGLVIDGTWNYYHILLFSENDLIIRVTQYNTSGDCDLYVRDTNVPTLLNYTYTSSSLASVFQVTVPSPGETTWQIGVYGFAGKCRYSIVAIETTSCPSNCSNHGNCSSDGICVCNPGWAGQACDLAAQQLSNGANVSGTVLYNQWSYFYIDLVNAYSLEIRMKEINDINYNYNYTTSYYAGALWLYESLVDFPDLRQYDMSETDTKNVIHTLTVKFQQPPVNMRAYIGVYGSPLSHTDTSNPFQVVAWYPKFAKS